MNIFKKLLLIVITIGMVAGQGGMLRGTGGRRSSLVNDKKNQSTIKRLMCAAGAWVLLCAMIDGVNHMTVCHKVHPAFCPEFYSSHFVRASLQTGIFGALFMYCVYKSRIIDCASDCCQYVKNEAVAMWNYFKNKVAR